MSVTRHASVSCDLDEIYNYCAIHDLSLADMPASAAHLVYDVALPRLCAWAREMQIPLTLFTVGADLRREQAAGSLREAHSLGHEIGNHSFSHRYDFSRLTKSDMRGEVLRSRDAIAQAVGEEPVGFRAPGYIVNDLVFEVLSETRVHYDASVFPCVPYYAAKAVVIAAMRAAGKRSRSIIGAPDVLLAPRQPYRIGRHYTERGAGLAELPIQTLPWSGVPFIGTTLTLAGAARAAWMARQCVGEPFVNLELHGVDVLSVEDGLQHLAAKQRDLRIALDEKIASLTAAVQTLKHANYKFVTMREAATLFLAA